MTYSSTGPSLAQAPDGAVDVDLRSFSSTLTSTSTSAAAASISTSTSTSLPPSTSSASPSSPSTSASTSASDDKDNSGLPDAREASVPRLARHPDSSHQDRVHARSAPLSPHARSSSSSNAHRHSRHAVLHQRRSDSSRPGEPEHGKRDQDDSQPHLDNRAAAADAALVTNVVQTVSLIQIVGVDGAPIERQTRTGSPATVVRDPASGSTISVLGADPSPQFDRVSTDDAQAGTEPADMNSSEPTPPSADSSQYHVPTVLPTHLSHDGVTTPLPTSTASSSESSGSQNVTSATSTDANTTATAASTQSTSQSTSEATTETLSSLMFDKLLSSSTTTSITSTDFTTSTASLSSSILSTIPTTTSTETWTSTWYHGDEASGSGGGGYGGATGVAQPAPSSTAPASNSSGHSGSLSKQSKQVIGGVVGSVAGLAFLALLVLLALRYKKKQQVQSILGGGDGTGNPTRQITAGGPDEGSGGPMAERTAPLSVAAAFATLSGKRASNTAPSIAEPASSGERGFYRVSGRKLTSVLHTGGDGYSDPRASVYSGQTDYWRGSQAFEPTDNNGSNHLALGSPMRPVSGVPIMRSGPARTPVTEENPFADPKPRPDSDALGGDSPIGGSLRSLDDPMNPSSRFQERM